MIRIGTSFDMVIEDCPHNRLWKSSPAMEGCGSMMECKLNCRSEYPFLEYVGSVHCRPNLQVCRGNRATYMKIPTVGFMAKKVGDPYLPRLRLAMALNTSASVFLLSISHFRRAGLPD